MRQATIQMMAILTGTGLVANLLCGTLATRERVLKLLALGLALLAAGLAVLPWVGGLAGAWLYAAAVGSSGGIITIVFFAAWGHLFGRDRLGRIQGIAQLGTVLASALGPVVVAESRSWSGSYSGVLTALAAAAGVLAVVALIAPLPRGANRPDLE